VNIVGERSKACCITGHRAIPADKINFVEQGLRKEIQSALDDGYRRFLSGFADGVDLIFARIVLEYKEKYPDIFLEAALPYPGWKRKGAEYNALLARCDRVGVYSPRYKPDCFLIRNKFMVDICDRVVVVYDGRGHGGTVNTLRCAQALNREIRMISV